MYPTDRGLPEIEAARVGVGQLVLRETESRDAP